MVHGYHVVFGTYGFWLPNDPRGSWSDFVADWELLCFGDATKTTTRRSVARKRHDAAIRQRAKQSLKYPPVVLTGTQAAAIGRGFAESIRKSRFTLWACSILPEHDHLVVARHRFKVEQVVNLLKGEATKRLVAEELHPLMRFRNPRGVIPTPWAENARRVYLDTEADILRSIQYVEQNPIKEKQTTAVLAVCDGIRWVDRLAPAHRAGRLMLRAAHSLQRRPMGGG